MIGDNELEPLDIHHPLDASLGEIHAIAIQLAMMGHHDVGMVLGKAHEQIQKYILESEFGDTVA